MDNWITVISFTYPYQAHIAKGLLESEGIEVLIKDELTTQVNNLYSNAIGGVKLQVKESELEVTQQILTESGYIKEQREKSNKLIAGFDRLTSKLPLLGKLIIEIRLLIIVALALIIIIFPIIILTLPTTIEKLTKYNWCVQKIYYKGYELTPNTIGFRMISDYDNCFETMYFNKNGTVVFPGINSGSEYAKWELRDDSLFITDLPEENYTKDINKEDSSYVADTSKKSIYHRIFLLEIKNNNISLKSDSMTILGRVYGLNYL